MSANSSISVELRQAIAIVRFANAGSGLIANKSAALLLQHLSELLGNPDVRVIVLTGEGDVFIRHADVGQIQRAGEALADKKISADDFVKGPFPKLGLLLDGAEKPVIAAINGTCMGGGFEIALACTTRIASATVAAIGLPEIRIDLFPGAGGTLRLPQLIGQSRARIFMLQGRVVDAKAALALGIVDEIAPCALTRALELAADLARRHPSAVAAILQLTRHTISEESLAVEQTAFAHLLRDHSDVRQRVAAFTAHNERLDQLP
jgi:enoyl-CoA hydratase/carnithine racemase